MSRIRDSKAGVKPAKNAVVDCVERSRRTRAEIRCLSMARVRSLWIPLKRFRWNKICGKQTERMTMARKF